MSDKIYVVITEDEDCCVGDMETITEWLCQQRSVDFSGCTFFELGKKVDVILEVVDKK